MPEVSIIIPLYNKAAFIAETLTSVSSQSFRDFECIVIDNGSTDDGWSIVERFEDDRVCLRSHTGARGPSAARNAGLDIAKGEWVLFLDADDLIARDHVEKLLEESKRSGSSTLVVSNWIEKNSDLSDRGEVKSVPRLESLCDSALTSAPWAVHAALIKRERSPRWPVEMDSLLGEDIVFWFDAVRRNEVGLSDSCGAVYRTHTENCRTRIEDVSAWFSGIDAAIRMNVSSIGILTTGQIEGVIRAYEALYSKAQNADDHELKVIICDRIDYWLRKLTENERSLKRSFRARKLLGAENWYRLQRFTGRVRL